MAKDTKASAKAVAQAVDILNTMDTAEMWMQSTEVWSNHADSDLYFNTLRYQDQAIS